MCSTAPAPEMEQARKRKRHEVDDGCGEDSEAAVDHVKTKLDRY